MPSMTFIVSGGDAGKELKRGGDDSCRELLKPKHTAL